MAAFLGPRTQLDLLMQSAERLLLEASDEDQVIHLALALLDDGFGYKARLLLGEDARDEGLLVPMIASGRSLGVIALDLPERMSIEAEREVAAFARLVGIAITSARARRAADDAHEETRRLSLTDELTGAFNVRHVMHRLREEIEFAWRHHDCVALLVVDGDSMKAVNDAYGHAEGNGLLQQMTTAMRTTLRLSDVLGRFGGDEFVLVLPRTCPKEARAAAERLRGAVAAHEFHTSGGTPIRATVSVGMASYPADGQTADDLFRAADRALYGAKQGGRDRVTAAGG
jgi:diguanylate cyclase (GGDEF)-like protein